MITAEEIKKRRMLCSSTEKLAKEFLKEESKGHRYLFGRNEHAALLSEKVEINAYVDDFVSPDATWMGKPVIHSKEIPLDAYVVNCSMCTSPLTSHNKLKEHGIEKVLMYADFVNMENPVVPPPVFVTQTRNDLLLNGEKWEVLRNTLADNQSQKTLNDIIWYRLTGNIMEMQKYSHRPKEQYFESFMKLKDRAVFVDAGGFDGDTTELFCLKYPTYKRVHLIEPSTTNIEKAKKRLINYRDIIFEETGLSDKAETLFFNPENGSASSIDELGTDIIKVVPLDNIVDDKIDFIKMDLEGWERKALSGAISIISKYRPLLAIAVYHHPSDFWGVFETVSRIRNDYQVFLRHYTEGWSETVMYFV